MAAKKLTLHYIIFMNVLKCFNVGSQLDKVVRNVDKESKCSVFFHKIEGYSGITSCSYLLQSMHLSVFIKSLK